MIGNETIDIRTILRSRENDLVRQLKRRDGIAIEQTSDVLDAVQVAGERELETRSLERESVLLREVRAALRRIDEGDYGVCLNCEEDISLKRLNALPWASLCIACQELEDRKSHGQMEPPAWMSFRAA